MSFTKIWSNLILLKSAVEIRLSSAKKKHQNPLPEAAVFYCLLHTGLRESELVNLSVGQYHSRGFHDENERVKKHLRKYLCQLKSKSILIATLKAKSQNHRGIASLVEGRHTSSMAMVKEVDPRQPLFCTAKRKKLSERSIRYMLERISDQASAHLPQEEKFHVSPHQLRHTFLKCVADKHGIHTAQDLYHNVSTKEIWRYTKPSQEEKEKIAEEIFD